MFGLPKSDLRLTDEHFLDKILSEEGNAYSENASHQQLKILPLFYGERQIPGAGASIQNWHPSTRIEEVKVFLKVFGIKNYKF